MKPQPVTLAFLAALALHGGTAPSTVTYLYTYNDRNGNIVINNMPPAFLKGQGLTLRHVGVGHVRLAMSRQEMAKVLRSPELLALVDSIATAEGIDPFLARAVIQAESAFYAKARSRAGALGLMQLMPQTAQRFGVVDPFDPRQNITGGVKYLKWLSGTFSGDLTKVVAAYNAGEGAVTKYRGVPPYAETRAYVPRVLELYSKHLVQPDPKAAGSMALLKKGRGGFQVDEAALPAKPTLEADASHGPSRPPTRLYQWVDANGRVQISDQPPAKGMAGVRTYQSSAE
ncbi:MAG: transglycosylase SLT domain-containing protein [Holophaga sp.]|nr:transglycosylase SLT domain-containing protein [Holophaga sp.]